MICTDLDFCCHGCSPAVSAAPGTRSEPRIATAAPAAAARAPAPTAAASIEPRVGRGHRWRPTRQHTSARVGDFQLASASLARTVSAKCMVVSSFSVGKRAMRDLIGYGGKGPHIIWPNGARLAISLVINFE